MTNDLFPCFSLFQTCIIGAISQLNSLKKHTQQTTQEFQNTYLAIDSTPGKYSPIFINAKIIHQSYTIMQKPLQCSELLIKPHYNRLT